MKFSLILSTKGRTHEIARLFEGFREQTMQGFEIIVSDQNDDDRVVDLLKQIAWPGRLTHIVNDGGLSAARNRALEIARGEIIAFPDDDCKYFPTLLEEVAAFFDFHPEYGFLSGRSVGDDGRDAASRHAREAGPIKRYKVYEQCIEFALFVRRDRIGDVRFDINMGVGCRTPWQADEGPDFMLNLIERGVQGYYDPRFAVWHPRVQMEYSQALQARTYKYACGSGYFLRKHNYPFWFFAKMNSRALAGVLVGLAKLDLAMARCYWARFRGRCRGWMGASAMRAI